MENAPLNHEDDDDEPDVVSGKKKKAESLASWLVETKPDKETKQPEEKADSIWDQLSQKLEHKPEDQMEEESADVEAVAEVSAAEAPLDKLSPVEEDYVKRQIIEAQPEADIPEVESFRQKVVEMTPEEAFTETLDEIEAKAAEPLEITEPEGEIYITHEAATQEDAVVPPPPAGPFGPVGGAPTPPGVGLSSPDSAPTAEEPEYRIDASPVANLLIGGIIGYLLGRRRGRIKTEKRLLPIQKKLEKQVETLQQDILSKEQRIRQVVRQHEAASVANYRRMAPEANQLHGKLPPEKIGQVVVTAEATPVKSSVERQVETLNRADLLRLSEKVIIEATTLRQLYETHLISEKGLRRIMVEHLRGGDVKRQLRRELVEHQIDYERDPILRDRTPLMSNQSAGSMALKRMFQQVDKLTSAQAKEELAIYKAKEAYEAAETIKNRQRQRVVDVAMISLITLLAVAVALLLFTRH